MVNVAGKGGAVNSTPINNILLIAVVIFAITAVITALYYGSGDEPKEQGFVSTLDVDTVVVLDADIFNQLSESYKNSVAERVYCLFGEKKGNEILIREIKEEILSNANENRAETFDEYACQVPGAIGTLHFHLPHRTDEVLCEPSLTDAYTFGTLAVKGEGHIVQAIQCGEDEFAFFDTSVGGYNAFEPKSYEWRIV